MTAATAPAPPPASPPAPFDKRPWLRTAVPDAAMRIKTMLTEEEGSLLYWLTRDYADGSGAVCDLGCFAGGSTARLAAGIADAGRKTRLAAFDHFTLSDPQKDRYLYPAGIAPFAGNDMLHAVRTLLAPWQDFVDLRQGDIRRTNWTDGPIEILFIDAAKSPKGADHIAATFFPHLMAGRSIIVQQDYLHWRQPWIPAQMQLLSETTTPVAWCQDGTVAFLVTAAIDQQQLRRSKVAALDDAAYISLLRDALPRFPKRRQRALLARAILGVQDNPGARLPREFDGSAVNRDRIDAVLAEF